MKQGLPGEFFVPFPEPNRRDSFRHSNMARISSQGRYRASQLREVKKLTILHQVLEPNSKVGIDPELIAACTITLLSISSFEPHSRILHLAEAKEIEKHLQARKSELVAVTENLVDAIWTDRPPRPSNKVFPLDEKYSGQSVKSKVEKVREVMEKKSTKAAVFMTLDEVAWLFNLRGSDIDFNPGAQESVVQSIELLLPFSSATSVFLVCRGHC